MAIKNISNPLQLERQLRLVSKLSKMDSLGSGMAGMTAIKLKGHRKQHCGSFSNFTSRIQLGFSCTCSSNCLFLYDKLRQSRNFDRFLSCSLKNHPILIHFHRFTIHYLPIRPDHWRGKTPSKLRLALKGNWSAHTHQTWQGRLRWANKENQESIIDLPKKHNPNVNLNSSIIENYGQMLPWTILGVVLGFRV